MEHLSKLHREIQYQNYLKAALSTFDDNKKRAIQQGINGKTLALLTVIPMVYHHHLPLLRLPALCDGCDYQFSTGHALDCRKGRLVLFKDTNEIDTLGDLASIAYKEVVREPIVREPTDQENVPALVADLSVHGVWQPQATTIFYVQVVDSDAKSYMHRDVGAVLSSIEHAKKQKYSQAAEIINASFTPFVVTADGTLGHDIYVSFSRQDSCNLAQVS